MGRRKGFDLDLTVLGDGSEEQNYPAKNVGNADVERAWLGG